MTIQNEEEYQLGMSRLDTLDSANAANLAEMEALGHALEAYEDRQGHAPLRPHAPCARIQLAAQGAEHGPGHDPRTDHLRPVIDFLLTKGNRPSHWWHEDGFWSDQGGELHYTFTDPIDAAELREHFAFPPSIHVSDDGRIKDGLNHFDISYDRPAPLFSFEGLPTTPASNQGPQPTLEPPATDDGTADEQLRRIIENRNDCNDRMDAETA